MLTRWRAAFLAAFVSLAAVLLTAAPASAHAYLVTTNPPDGSVIKLGPQTVWLEFNDQLDASLVKIAIIDSNGHAIAPTAVAVDPVRPTRLDVTLPNLPRGVYRLSFHVRDSVDLHLTDGTISLGVGTAPTGPPARPASPPPDWVEVLMRWLGAAGLAAMLGGLTVAFLVVPRALSGPRRRGVRRAMLAFAIGGAVVALLGDTILLAYEAASIGPLASTFSRLLATSSLGERWRAEATITAALIVLLAWIRYREARTPSAARPERWPAVALVAGGLAVADAVAVGFGSHTGGSASPTAGGVVLRAAHLLAVGAWIGGVMAMAVTLVVLAREPEARRAVLRSFSRIAAIGLAAVVATGLLLSAAEVSTVTALLSTWYGGFLVAKLALVAVVVVIGWRHRRIVTKRPVRLRAKSLAWEAAVGAVVIGLGATMAATLPARGPQFSRPPVLQPSTLTSSAADVLVQLSVAPNRPGTNLITVLASNIRRPAPAPITGVTLVLSSPVAPRQVLQTKQAADGSWSGGDQNLAPGPITVVATVHRAGLPDAETTVPFVVNAAPAWHQSTVVSQDRWAPIADWAAGAVIALAAIGFVVGRRRSGRRGQARHRRERGEPRHAASRVTGVVADAPDALLAELAAAEEDPLRLGSEPPVAAGER
jgi:copper transport protein